MSAGGLQRLAKWRTLLTGWQLGTRPRGDPEGDAVRDHREATLVLRAEVTALTRLLIEAEVITLDQLTRVLDEEADHLSEALSRRFPGIRATDIGLTMDARAAQTMKGWKP